MFGPPLPELVVAVTSVRRGSLSLAVGDSLGGSSYDLLILVVLDAVYRDGTISSAVGPAEMAWVVLSIVLVSTLILGLLRRQKHGVGNVGFETVLMLAVYAGGVGAITLS